MLSHTRLAAVGFNDGQNKYRVFYQDSSLLLKESCFEESKGWYVRENCIVANDAKKLTPLAAVSWASGTEIRVYYMNNKNKIVERKWSVDGTEEFGVWQAGGPVECTTPDPLTRLAATCVEEPDGSLTLRLFYQSAHRELRQTSYSSERSEWKDAALESDNGAKIRPIQGTSLAASTGVTTRVFYLSGPRDITLIKEDGNKWKGSKLTLYRRVRAEQLQRIHAAEKTPIAVAPPLFMDDPCTENRLATFFTGHDGKLLKMFFDTETDAFTDDERTGEIRVDYGRTKDSSHYDTSSEAEVVAGGSIAVAFSFEHNARVFYQSSSTTISVYDVIHGSEVRVGIPTSEGGGPRVHSSGEGPDRQPPPAANRENEVGVSFGSGLLTASELARFEFPMTERLRNPSEAEHLAYSIPWTAAWKMWSRTYDRHGRMAGLKNWDILALHSIVDNFADHKALFLPRARETDWNRYWDMPTFKCCSYVGCQRDLWKLAKARKLSNASSLSNEEWEKVLQNFSLFMWFDFYVMKYEFMNPSSPIFPSIYSYAFSL
ncbi:hypothetical protein F5B21DRAFT_155446 [Xylaria acuta]|nr:hypothetical protein F5B21DRAFT_155446 [Xylaria acuta]